MEDIKLNSLSLRTFDKNNEEHLKLFKKLIRDESVTKRFQGLLSHLTSSGEDGILNKGFLIADNDNLVGYFQIGSFNPEEKCVYLRAAIDKDFRGHKYGKRILSDASDYLFQHYDKIEKIKIKIAHDNISSLKTAESCGYKWLRDDFYGLDNPYLEKKNIK